MLPAALALPVLTHFAKFRRNLRVDRWRPLGTAQRTVRGRPTTALATPQSSDTHAPSGVPAPPTVPPAAVTFRVTIPVRTGRRWSAKQGHFPLLPGDGQRGSAGGRPGARGRAFESRQAHSPNPSPRRQLQTGGAFSSWWPRWSTSPRVSNTTARSRSRGFTPNWLPPWGPTASSLCRFDSSKGRRRRTGLASSAPDSDDFSGVAHEPT